MQRKGFQGRILDTFGVTSDPEEDHAWTQASLVSKPSQDTPELPSEDASLSQAGFKDNSVPT